MSNRAAQFFGGYNIAALVGALACPLRVSFINQKYFADQLFKRPPILGKLFKINHTAQAEALGWNFNVQQVKAAIRSRWILAGSTGRCTPIKRSAVRRMDHLVTSAATGHKGAVFDQKNVAL